MSGKEWTTRADILTYRKSPGGGNPPSSDTKDAKQQPTTMSTSKPATDGTEKGKTVEKPSIKPESGSGVGASRTLKPDKTAEINQSLGVGEGGVDGSKVVNPMIQVTRASYSFEDEVPVPPKGGVPPPPPAGHATQETKADALVEARGLGAPHAFPATSSTSLQIQQQGTEPPDQQEQQQEHRLSLDQGIIVTSIGSFMLLFGILLVGVGLPLFGFALVVFGLILLLSGFIYLAHYGIERYMERRQKHFREIALTRAPAWLTKPSSPRSRLRLLKKSSVAEIS